jgi:hypothetical protein
MTIEVRSAETHTPGPWEVWTSNSYRRIGSARGALVCEPVTQHDGHPDLHFRNGGAEGPDARLIAAAPDLLKALRQIAIGTAGYDGLTMSEIYDIADEAIGKATAYPKGAR